MKNLFFTILSIICFMGIHSLSISQTHTNNILKVPQEYKTIQEAINQSVHGDTIMVSEGRYYENINYTGKNVRITSYYSVDGNPAHIFNTIIDGSKPADSNIASCVRLVSGENSNAVLDGFTLTGGKGTIWLDNHNHLKYREGGGVLINASSPVIRNNLIISNFAMSKMMVASAGGCASAT